MRRLFNRCFPSRRAVLTSAILLGGAVVSAGPLSLGSNKGKDAPSYVQPAENLLLIVADVQRHVRDDIYRFPYPTDVTGQNIFRMSLVRLANYEKLYPGKMKDVVALTKAQAWERLCAFQEAGANYKDAQDSKDENIKKMATDGFERCKKLSGAADMPIDQSSLRTFERDLRARIGGLGQIAQDLRKTQYECLALAARERAQMQLAEFYIAMRFMQPYTTKDAEDELKRNIDVNPNSKMLFAHHLRLADFYYELGCEYVLKNTPEGSSFSMKDFEAFTNPARAEYKIVEEADGYPEKLEGRAKLLALEAFVDRITDRAR